MKIKDLRVSMNGITIEAKVIEKSRSKISNQKKYAYAIIEDETGRIKLNLWRDQVEQVSEGDIIKVTEAFVHRRGKVTQISTWVKIEKIH